MNHVINEEGLRPIKVWADQVDDLSMSQLRSMATLPFIAPQGIAVMPDVHAGKGSTIGSVIPTQDVLIPAAVGVDLGCGMCAAQLSISASDLPESLAPVRAAIEKLVPVGFAQHAHEIVGEVCVPALNTLPPGPLSVIDKHLSKMLRQMGTLGGGNHFIELCLDENDRVWVMLHSGSRGIGNLLASKYIDLAKEEMARWHIDLPDKDLAYLPKGSAHYGDYVAAVHWAQEYAKANRDAMMSLVFSALTNHLRPFAVVDAVVNCHHNYVEMENHFGRNLWVTRKGAIRARQGDMGIIPGSMGQRSYIVVGLGEQNSYCSCSHGAGRLLSRNQARARFTVEDLVEQTKGVECRKDEGVLDEAPGSYKDIDRVMAQQTDLVKVVHTLKQVLCVKG